MSKIFKFDNFDTNGYDYRKKDKTYSIFTFSSYELKVKILDKLIPDFIAMKLLNTNIQNILRMEGIGKLIYLCDPLNEYLDNLIHNQCILIFDRCYEDVSIHSSDSKSIRITDSSKFNFECLIQELAGIEYVTHMYYMQENVDDTIYEYLSNLLGQSVIQTVYVACIQVFAGTYCLHIEN